MQVQPYISFEGHAEEAIEHYKNALGAQIKMILRVKDAPCPPHPDMSGKENENKVLHAEFAIGDSVLSCTDVSCGGKTKIEGIRLTLNAADADEAKHLFDGLADGGQVQQPLIETFFSPAFGMLADRFGVPWTVVSAPKS